MDGRITAAQFLKLMRAEKTHGDGNGICSQAVLMLFLD